VGTSPTELLYAFVTLLAMVNPVEAAAAFATLTEGRAHADQARIALRATVAGCAILLAFAFGGDALLRALGVSLPAFKIAGGLLLLKVGFNMVFAEKTDRDAANTAKAAAPASDPAIFPLAIPIITGPGALTAAVTLVTSAHDAQIVLTDATFLGITLVVFAITYVTMRGAEQLNRVLGPTCVDATGRLVGIIVAAIAVQMVINGVAGVTNGLVH
jgi:multiple antibiotic resistance protein